MRRRGWALAIAVTLVVGPIAAAVGPATGASEATTEPADAFETASTGVDRWSQAVPEDSPAGALASLAEAGLGFAQDEGVQRGDPASVLEALGPLVEAQSDTQEALLPGPLEARGQASPHSGAVEQVRSVFGAEPDEIEARGALEIAAELNPSADAQPWLDTSREVLERIEAQRMLAEEGSATPTERTLATLELQPRLAPEHELPAMPDFESLPAAVYDLLAFYDHTPTKHQLQGIEALADLPVETERALKRIVEAHLFQAEATQLAFDSRDTMPALISQPTAQGVSFDRDVLLEARASVAQTVMEAEEDLAPVAATGHGNLPRICGVVAFDLTAENSTYTCDYHLQIELGGNDTYHNNAGGAQPDANVIVDENGVSGPELGAAMVVDEAGDDDYLADETALQSVNGGSSWGSGFLFDASGNDTYAVNRADVLLGAVNGGGRGGSGFLLDHGGNDTYAVRLSVDDPNPDPVLLLEFGGAMNGGGSAHGSGLMVDHRGNDTYSIEIADEDSSTYQNYFLALNGGGLEASGALLDRAGNDTYEVLLAHRADGQVQVGGNGGAALSGSGLLVDEEGNDTYRARLVDNGSSDETIAVGLNGGGGPGGSGLLADGGGNDTYRARLVRNGSSYGDVVGGVNGGGNLGQGVLLDGDGRNRFLARVASNSGAMVGANGGASNIPIALNATASWPGGLGLLVGGEGNDTYISNGTSQGAAVRYGVGVLVDPGGNNSYNASPVNGTGLAQGAGQHGGVGVLLDGGHHAKFNLSGSVAGQGLGQQGVGLLAHTNPRGNSEYHQPEDVLGSLGSDGAGAGLIVDAGTVESSLAIPECRTATLATTDAFDVCLPDEANTSRPIINPLTGQPIGEVPHTSVPCSSLGVGPVWCDEIVGALLGEEAVEYLEMDSHEARTSGALDLLVLGEPGQAGPSAPEPSATGGGAQSSEAADSLAGRMVLQSYDHSCHASCHTLRQVAETN